GAKFDREPQVLLELFRQNRPVPVPAGFRVAVAGLVTLAGLAPAHAPELEPRALVARENFGIVEIVLLCGLRVLPMVLLLHSMLLNWGGPSRAVVFGGRAFPAAPL